MSVAFEMLPFQYCPLFLCIYFCSRQATSSSLNIKLCNFVTNVNIW